MRGVIIGVSGHAGCGKDTFADRLEKRHNFVKVGLADPLKRFCGQVFGFTEEQLWGPSDSRNAVDPMWGISPRVALQTLGTEWGRKLHPDVWVRKAISTAVEVLEYDLDYDRSGSWRGYDMYRPTPARGVVIPDCRFKNEMQAIKDAGGFTVRIIRPGSEGKVGIEGHQSEAEQNDVPNSEFDFVIYNNRDLENFLIRIDNVAETAQSLLTSR